MIIKFIRHADSKNDKLTKLGKKQCKLAFKQKDSISYSKIYSSSAGRCVRTARYYQSKLKLQVEVVEGISERELLKTKEPQTEQEKLWYDNYLNPMFSNEEPEGCKEFLARNFIEFNRIIDEHIDKDENVIIVAHSGTFYALMAYINGIQKNQDLIWYRLNNCAQVIVEIKSRIK